MKKSEARTILGVSFTATEDDIKLAHRDACKQHHPDIGGSRDMFELTQIAYKCLITSEIEPEISKANSELMTAFQIAIDQIKAPEQVDLIYRVKDIINKGIETQTKALESIKKEQIKLSTIINRLSSNRNMAVINMLMSRIDDLTSALEETELKIATLKMALELASEHKYIFDQPENNFGGLSCVFN